MEVRYSPVVYTLTQILYGQHDNEVCGCLDSRHIIFKFYGVYFEQNRQLAQAIIFRVGVLEGMALALRCFEAGQFLGISLGQGP